MARPILIIEDDRDIAELLSYSLEWAKFEARVAYDGESGLAASLDERNPPAVILVDLLLPGMNGLEICRRLRREKRTGKIPIVMVTAKSSEADCARAYAAGVDEYISKPFSVQALVGRVIALARKEDPLANQPTAE